MNLQASIRIPRRAKDGIDGDTGKGISEVKDFYGLSSSETSEPTEWFSYIPDKPADKYLWNYEKIIYTDGTSTDTKKRVIQGKDARSIESVVNAYAYSASETVAPTSGWRSTIASLGARPDGYFLWVRDDITYTDGTSSSTAGYVVKEGTDGYSVTLSKDSHTYTYDKDGNLKGPLSNGATTISVQRGDILFKCDTTSIGLTPVANNTYRVVAIEVDGVSYSGASRTLVNNELKIWPSAFAGETGSMTFTIRAMSDGVVSKDFKKTISFSKNKDGADGKEGLPGIPGQVPFIKEWVVGDTHRNTDEIVDFIYVRGRDKQTSYYYKKTNKGSSVAASPPSGGEARAGYERVDWLKELAVQVLIAEESNMANFIFKDEKLISMRGKTFAGLEILYGEYTEYEFTNQTTQPSVGSSYWTNLPEGTTRFIRFKKNTENDWTVKAIGTYGDRWTVQYADRPDASSWDNSFATGRVWMQIKEAGEQDFRDAVKIDVSDGYDFIPKTYLDGVNGDVKISGEISAKKGNVGDLFNDESGMRYTKDTVTGEVKFKINSASLPSLESLLSQVDMGNNVYNPFRNYAGNLSNQLNVEENGSRVWMDGTYTVDGVSEAWNKPLELPMPAYARVHVDLYKGSVFYKTISVGSLRVIPQTTEQSFSQTLDITGEAANVDKGLYNIRLSFSGTEGIKSVGGRISDTTTYWEFKPADFQRLEIALNGLMQFYTEAHWRFTKDGRDVRGKTNMPGVLASGTVTNGGLANPWGAKIRHSQVITGGFRIHLKDMTHNEYSVQVTPHTNTTFRVNPVKTSASFEILGTGNADFVVFGSNY